ncbi:MAG TPA: hypothetical protein VLG76_08590 [Rhabdochlamydiaceae bacterium]|nr:hypothetical protein [Rhabdochlamydiaceae bacterium]
MEPLQRATFGIQTYQDNKDLLSITDRKVQNSRIYEILVTIGTLLVLSALVISCIVTPVLLYGVVPLILGVVYKILSSSKKENPIALETQLATAPSPIHFVGLNNQYNECFLNAALQFLEDTPLYEEIISNNKDLEMLKNIHEGITRARQNNEGVAEHVDTHALRLWLRDKTKYVDVRDHDLIYEISEYGQEDASILLETLFRTGYSPLPLYNVRFRPHASVLNPQEQLHLIDLQINSSDFIQNHNAFFWDIPDRHYNFIRQFNDAPTDYFIRLKRFNAAGQKITTDVNVPETYSLTKDMHTMGNDATYEIDRFIQHRGSSIRGGHYVAFRKVIIQGVEAYLEFNDRYVGAITKEQFYAQMKQAYWLHAIKKS